MNFEFDPEIRLFSQQLRRALEAKAPLEEVQHCMAQRRSSEAAWGLLLESGLCGAVIPKAFGGSGLGPYPLCLGAQEIGRALAPIPALSSLYLATEALLAASGTPPARRWLPPLASGEAIGTAALTLQRQLRLEDGRLHGTAEPVPDTGDESFAILLTAEERLVLVELSADGVEREALQCVDPSRPLGRLSFSGVPAAVIGDERAAESALLRASVYAAFEAVGGAEGALELALRYGQERRAFGRPVGSYQAIKHKLADVWVRTEIARAHATYAAWASSNDSSDLALAAAAAHIAATEAFLLAARESLHVHGAYGFTLEAPCHLYYRRARSLAAALGPSPQWRQQLGAQLAAGSRPLH